LLDKPENENADPLARERRRREYYAASHDLRQALSREVWEEDVLDTVGDQEPPAAVIRCGDARVADWEKAASIRRELERLTTARG